MESLASYLRENHKYSMAELSSDAYRSTERAYNQIHRELYCCLTGPLLFCQATAWMSSNFLPASFSRLHNRQDSLLLFLNALLSSILSSTKSNAYPASIATGEAEKTAGNRDPERVVRKVGPSATWYTS